jgi:hypothetical protein
MDTVEEKRTKFENLLTVLEDMVLELQLDDLESRLLRELADMAFHLVHLRRGLRNFVIARRQLFTVPPSTLDG